MKDILHIYTRVSSANQQEDGTSLESQKQQGIKKAAELGFDSRLWNEGGQSSHHDDFKNRPVLVSLLTQIESGVVKHLFVYNTDRLSRNQQTWAVIRYKLLTHGVTLHTESGQMKLKNPVDDLMLGILSEISQYDNKIRSERSRLGRFHKVQQGNWKGGPPPFGYRLINRKLEIDPFESEWIKKIYDWYCHGVSAKEIQNRLSRQGVMTRRGNAQWSLGSIRMILMNSVYVGYFDYSDKMVGETVRITSPQIIDSHLYQIAQDKRQLTRVSKKQGTIKHFYLLRGLLTCGDCGSHLGGRTHRAGHQHVYYCPKRERSWKTREQTDSKWVRGKECSMLRSINIEMTDRLIWDLIKSTLREIRERQDDQGEEMGLEEHSHYEGDGISTEGFSWVTAEQADMLSDEERKVLINNMITTITVHFDAKLNKHRLTVRFSEEIRRLFEKTSTEIRPIVNNTESSSGDSGTLCEVRDGLQGENSGKKSWGSRINSAAKIDYSVTVE